MRKASLNTPHNKIRNMINCSIGIVKCTRNRTSPPRFMCYVLCIRPHPLEYQIRTWCIHLSSNQLIRLSSIQLAFKLQTIWHPNSFRPFQCQTILVLRSPQHNIKNVLNKVIVWAIPKYRLFFNLGFSWSAFPHNRTAWSEPCSSTPSNARSASPSKATQQPLFSSEWKVTLQTRPCSVSPCEQLPEESCMSSKWDLRRPAISPSSRRLLTFSSLQKPRMIFLSPCK